jgi:hypothetical protein
MMPAAINTAQFAVIAGLIVSVLTIASIVARASFRMIALVIKQIDATEANTAAIHNLSHRMTKIENRAGRWLR